MAAGTVYSVRLAWWRVSQEHRMTRVKWNPKAKAQEGELSPVVRACEVPMRDDGTFKTSFNGRTGFAMMKATVDAAHIIDQIRREPAYDFGVGRPSGGEPDTWQCQRRPLEHRVFGDVRTSRQYHVWSLGWMSSVSNSVDGGTTSTIYRSSLIAHRSPIQRAFRSREPTRIQTYRPRGITHESVGKHVTRCRLSGRSGWRSDRVI